MCLRSSYIRFCCWMQSTLFSNRACHCHSLGYRHQECPQLPRNLPWCQSSYLWRGFVTAPTSEVFHEDYMRQHTKAFRRSPDTKEMPCDGPVAMATIADLWCPLYHDVLVSGELSPPKPSCIAEGLHTTTEELREGLVGSGEDAFPFWMLSHFPDPRVQHYWFWDMDLAFCSPAGFSCSSFSSDCRFFFQMNTLSANDWFVLPTAVSWSYLQS